MMTEILHTLAVMAMSEAVYFSTGSVEPAAFGHFGLALRRYTHFTSPIRRYADVVVHRQLLQALQQSDRAACVGSDRHASWLGE
jgi:DIS3-like exonuclease 1